MFFKDRIDAGQKLAASLSHYKNGPNTIAIGLPRGGVIVANEVARALQIPLDVIVPRKIGAPYNEEFAIGAIADDVVWLDPDVDVPKSYIDASIAKEKQEAARRLLIYRKGKPVQHFEGMTVILIDDGIATGATMRVSIELIRKQWAKKIIVAVPVAPPEILNQLEADEIICLYSPSSFMAVGQFYETFEQVEDSVVAACLK